MMTKALIVDDSRAMRLILSRTLTELGFEVDQAANGREALEIFKQRGASFGLALVDWNMPELSGIEFIRRVRAVPEFNSVRLMMVTSEIELEQMSLALEAGADEYVMKPFTREAVEDKLRLLGVIE